MRVLLITGSYPPMKCGVGDYTYSLAKALAANSEVHIGVLTNVLVVNNCKTDGIEIFPVIEKWGLAEAFKVINIVRSWAPDIVHIQYETQGYKNGLLPRVLPLIFFLMRKKVVQTWHGGCGRRDVLKCFLRLIIPGALVVVHRQYMDNFHRIYHWILRARKPIFIRNASAIPRVTLDVKEMNKIKMQYLNKQKRLIVFFGFVYPHKGVELIFEIANPDTDQIVIAGEIDEKEDYSREILRNASVEPWLGKVTITGFLPLSDVAALLRIADAVILPFRIGGGEWNTSIHGAVMNGAFVITTSLTQNGYDKKRNIYFAKVDNIQEMSSALSIYAGMRREDNVDIDRNEWVVIADEHYALYKSLILE
jgi:glycosyltransferase involved in cell wall biosynthesis